MTKIEPSTTAQSIGHGTTGKSTGDSGAPDGEKGRGGNEPRPRAGVAQSFAGGSTYGVLGAGKSGQAAARLLRGLGKGVTIHDDKADPAQAEGLAALAAEGIAVDVGRRRETAEGLDGLVVSPGVPWTHPLLVDAGRRRVPVLGELELGWLHSGAARHVGVTGTNGKTTVTMLLEKMLNDGGLRSIAAGNIGYALCDAAREHAGELDELTFALELSSFQLEAIEQFRPEVAIVLNVTPDHLDRYESIEAYARAKERITERQTGSEVLVINQDDAYCMAMGARSRARVRRFSLERPVDDGAWLDGDLIYLAEPGRKARRLMAMDELKMIGLHNVANAMAAACACDALGVSRESIARTLAEFRAAPHRMEYVGEKNGVAYVNDSKATNLDAMVRAVGSFSGGIHLIAGGRDKNSPFAQFTGELTGRVRRLYLIGEAARDMEAAWGGAIECRQCGTLENALAEATAAAVEGEVILLSPACASFDQFRAYSHRGDVFKAWVRERIEN